MPPTPLNQHRFSVSFLSLPQVLMLSHNKICNEGLQAIIGAVCCDGCRLSKLFVKQAGIDV